MNDNDSQKELSDNSIDKDIKALLLGNNTDVENNAAGRQRQKAITRARVTMAQRDTILFAFIKIWATIAEMLAPLFAAFATKHARHSRPASRSKSPNHTNKK